MSKCRENQLKNYKSTIPVKTKSNRECGCFKEYNQLKNNLKVIESTCRNCPDNRPETNKQLAEEKIVGQKENKPQSSNRNKTWLEVLRESPSKENRKVLQANDKNVNFTRKCNPVSSNSTDPKENLVQNIDLKQFSSTLNNENFLRNLIEFNRFIQAVCSKTVDIKSPEKIPHTAADRDVRRMLKTDIDKWNLRKPQNISKSPIKEKEKHKETADLQVKALIKLLESMQSVTESSQVQRDAIQNLTQLIVQLRNENKMLEKLKEIRIDLETKLASACVENTYLKKQLQSYEEERDKSNRLLLVKENEIQMLKKQITMIEQHNIRKNDFVINYDIGKPSLELHNLDDTIASAPSNNQSFDALIRPASSSPTEEVTEQWRYRKCGRRQEDDDSGIQSTSNMLTESQLRVLSKVNENVKKTTQYLQTDLKMNDVSLNLSNVTYKLS